MRKDSIAEGAYKKALELYSYSESNFHKSGIDAEDVPVLAPQVSKLKREDEPWQPESAFYGNKPRGSGPPSFNYTEETGTPEYNRHDEELGRLMEMADNLGGRLRMARQRGNFQEEQRIVQERNDVMKAISAVRAKLMVNDLGRHQRDMNDGMMYHSQNQQDFAEFAEAIDASDAKISRLEQMLESFAEGRKMKSPGGDSAADPGQSNSVADGEEDDEEEDEDMLGDG
jgi:hypothetical protein